MSDPVNHPAHYTHGAIECIDAIEAAMTPDEFRGYLKGQIMKYTWRLGRKDAPAQDAGKIRWYSDRLEATLRKAASLSHAPTDEKIASVKPGAVIEPGKERIFAGKPCPATPTGAHNYDVVHLSGLGYMERCIHCGITKPVPKAHDAR